MLGAFVLINERWDTQFKVDSERQIFEKVFHGIFIYSQCFCQKFAESKSLLGLHTSFLVSLAGQQNSNKLSIETARSLAIYLLMI